jgi:putative membrane protein
MHGPNGHGMASAASAIVSAIVPLVVIAFACGLYIRGWWRVRSRVPSLASPWRAIAFGSGLMTVWLAMWSPLAAWHERMLLIHMLQHLLLSALAAPLILLGAPTIPILYGLPQSLARLSRTRVVRACCHQLGDPLVSWSTAVIVFIAWHVPALFQLGLASTSWHLFEQGSFFVSGLMFWWPIVQPWPSRPRWPRWSMPLYLFFATLPCDAISAFLAFSDRVVYPAYLTAPRPAGWSALQDQECAGAFMWLVVTLAYTVPAAAIAVASLVPLGRNSRDNCYFSQ